MELNKINSSGTTWGAEASALNENFGKIDSSIEQLKNSTTRNKGYFSSEAALKSAVPTAAKGDKAYVGSAYPYQIWTWNGSAWVNSGSTGGEESVNLGNYHTAEYVDGKLSELGSLVGSVVLIGKGYEGVFTKINNIIPGHTYRIYLQKKWSIPENVPSDYAYLEVYYPLGGGNYNYLVHVNASQVLSDYYDISVPLDYPTDKPMYIYTRANQGEKLTFILVDTTDSIINNDLFKIYRSYYIQGKGTNFSSIKYYGSANRIYRISLASLMWDAVKPYEDASIFYLSTTDKNGVESQITTVTSFENLKDWYEVKCNQDTQYINIGGRAAKGTNIMLSIDDVTERLESMPNGHISSYVSGDMVIEGEYVPIMNQGYIAFQQPTVDINNVTLSAERRYSAIECKEGDIYMVQGVGGNSARLFFLVDKDGNTLSYSNADYDTTEQPFFFRCYTDGYFVVNVSVRYPYKVVKVNTDKLKDYFNCLPYIRWSDGFMDVNTGGVFSSTVNKCTGYVPTFGYTKIKIKENSGVSSAATSGITFYDSKRQYIKGFVCTKDDSRGVVERVYNIPENAAYFRTTIFADYLTEAIVELFNDKRSVDLVGFRNLCNFVKVDAEDSFEMADWTGQQVIDNIYEPLRAAYPQYITRKSLGKDATGTYDIWCYEFNNSADEWFSLNNQERFYSSSNVIPPLQQGLSANQFALGKSFWDNNKNPYSSLYANSAFEVRKPTKVVDIAESTFNGNPFYVFTCVDAVESTIVEDKPCVTLWYVHKVETQDQHGVIISGTHADEISGYIGVGLALKYMIEHHSENESLNYIFNSVKLTVVPIVNIWGANQNPKARQNADGVSMSNYGNPNEYPSELIAIDNLMKDVRNDAAFFIDFHTSEWWNGYGMTYAITDHKSPLYPAIIATSNYLCRHWFPSLPPFNWNIGQSSGTGTIYSTTRAKEVYDIPSSTIEFTGLDLISFSGCKKWDSRYMSMCIENYLNYLIALCELRLTSKPEKLIGIEFFNHITMS